MERGASACRGRDRKGRNSSDHKAPENPHPPCHLIPCCSSTPPPLNFLPSLHFTDPIWRHSKAFCPYHRGLSLNSPPALKHFIRPAVRFAGSHPQLTFLKLSAANCKLQAANAVYLSFTARRSHKQISFLPPPHPGLGLSSLVCVHGCVCVCGMDTQISLQDRNSKWVCDSD